MNYWTKLNMLYTVVLTWQNCKVPKEIQLTKSVEHTEN